MKKTVHLFSIRRAAEYLLLLLSMFFFLAPPALRLYAAEDSYITLWHQDTVQSLRWVIIILLSTLSLYVLKGVLRRETDLPNTLFGLSAVTAAAVAALLLLNDVLPRGSTSNILFFGPSLVLSLWLYAAVERRSDFFQSGRAVVAGLVLFVIGYTALGWHLEQHAGKHVGDEGHYLIQAQSLYEDGDLDVHNNIQQNNYARFKPNYKEYYHIAPNSKEGRWYSYHPVGLPLLLFPLWGAGSLARWLLLAVIGALSLLAVRQLSLRLGVTRSLSTWLALLLGSSAFWALYVARTLPEVLGAMLLTWSFWAVFAQKDKPLRSSVVLVLTGVFLFWVHERFIPLSLLTFGYFGLRGLALDRPWRLKVVRLGLVTLAYGAGVMLFLLYMHHFFEGGRKFDIELNYIMSMPVGLWGSLMGHRGLVVSLPLCTVMLTAPVVLLVRKGPWRLYTAAVLAMLVSILVLACSSYIYTGGSCVPGRYLLAVTPLFIPLVGIMYERTSALGKWWIMFMAAMSSVMLLLIIVNMSSLGMSYIMIIHSLRRANLWWVDFFNGFGVYYTDLFKEQRPMQTIFAVWLLFTTLVIMWGGGKKRAILQFFLLSVAVGLGIKAHSTMYAAHRSQWIAQHLKKVDLQDVRVTHSLKEPVEYFDFVGLHLTKPSTSAVLTVTTKHYPGTVPEKTIAQPHIDVNDWRGRPYRWATLRKPRPATAGEQLLLIEGTKKGPGMLYLTVREGEATLIEQQVADAGEGKYRAVLRYRCAGKSGHLYILCRLEGTADFHLQKLMWAPFSAAMTNGTGLYVEGPLYSSPGSY